jgi:hypothetical protein
MILALSGSASKLNKTASLTEPKSLERLLEESLMKGSSEELITLVESLQRCRHELWHQAVIEARRPFPDG